MAYKRVMNADPFLMSAAIAYNTLFAMVPLAFALVAGLSVAGSDLEVVAGIENMIAQGVAEEGGEFVLEVFDEAQSVADDLGPTVLVIALLVALWSGSRAIYAVQKALRLMDGVEDHRPYWKRRGLGILFTLGAGFALIFGYVIVIFGGWVIQAIEYLGIHVGSATWITGAVMFGWVTAVSYSIYEWATPIQIRRPFISAVVASSILAVVTIVAALILPEFGSSKVAAIGSVGVVLVWAYFIGFVVIVVPAAVASLEDVVRGAAE